MPPTFDTINSTNALCTYIASNSIAFGPGTKSATAEKTAHQINPKIGASSVQKESDALPKRDHRSTAHASDHDRNRRSDHGDTSPEWRVGSKTGRRYQYKQPLEDTNRNKESHDRRSRRTSNRKDAFTPTKDLVLGSRIDHLAGPPLHDDGIEIGATTDTCPLNRDNRQDSTSSNVTTKSLGLADYQHKEEMQKPPFSRHIELSPRSDRPSRDSTTTVAEGRTSLRHSITSQIPRARNPTELSNSVDPVLNLDPPSPKQPLEPSPAEKPGRENPETRHHRQRRFDGQRQKPHTAKWIAQRIQEESLPIALGILSAWTHHTRRVEASEATINELNAVTDTHIVEALNELRTPKRFVRRNGGNKLETRIILGIIDNSQSLETTALLDSGCTGLTIHHRFVKEHNLPTQQLPRPIPVYNADGTLNANGAIAETEPIQSKYPLVM